MDSFALRIVEENDGKNNHNSHFGRNLLALAFS